MRDSKRMSIKGTIGIILLTMILAFTGCNVGGANIRLKGVSLGAIVMNEKPVEGLPSEKIDLLLEVSAREITVEYSPDGAIVTLSPSGATLEIKASGILINGIKPEQIKVESAVSRQD